MPDPEVYLIGVGLVAMVVAIMLWLGQKPYFEILGLKVGTSDGPSGERPRPGWVGGLFIISLFGVGLVVAAIGGARAAIRDVSELNAAVGDSRGAIEDLVTPVPTPTPVEPSADELFSLAFADDEAGNGDEAIQLYSLAIDAGLDTTRAELSHIEIGLLELLEIEEEPDDPLIDTRCNTAESNLEAAEMISLPEHEELVNDLRELLTDSVCTAMPP